MQFWKYTKQAMKQACHYWFTLIKYFKINCLYFFLLRRAYEIGYLTPLFNVIYASATVYEYCLVIKSYQISDVLAPKNSIILPIYNCIVLISFCLT